MGRVHSGEAFGEKSALMGTDHTHTVLATGACSLLAISQKAFRGTGVAGHYLELLRQKLKFLGGFQLQVPPRLASRAP